MTLADLNVVLDWAADEGWNPGLDDASVFLASDPEGFFVVERNQQPIAAISVVNHSDDFAFLGLYLCKAEWRGQGIGYALWSEALRHADGRTVGLDGVAAQQANYAKSGFALADSTVRLEGMVGAQCAASAPVSRAGPQDFTALNTLDGRANGFARPKFLAGWLSTSSDRETFVMQGRARTIGFATIRRCRHGAKIGPVIAPDTATAMDLIFGAATEFGERSVIVDIPATNAPLIAALLQRGFVETFRTARMYRGPAPVAGQLLQAVGTLELG